MLAPAIPMIEIACFIVANPIAHAVVEPILGASLRAPSGILVLQFATFGPSRHRALLQDIDASAVVQAPPVVVQRARALDRECTGQKVAGFVFPRLGALQSNLSTRASKYEQMRQSSAS